MLNLTVPQYLSVSIFHSTESKLLMIPLIRFYIILLTSFWGTCPMTILCNGLANMVALRTFLESSDMTLIKVERLENLQSKISLSSGDIRHYFYLI